MDSLPENSLSDDISEWPVSPYGILGLERNAERADVRRAYSGLIKRFRPETHPQHFQRIREAFETVLTVVEARGHASVTVDLGQPGESERREFPEPGKPLHASTIEQSELIWDRFSKQPHVDQYIQLKAIAGTLETSAESFLIGYWMLRLRPDFAAAERPAEWLLRGLQAHGTDWRLVDLLMDESRRDQTLTHSDFSGHVAALIHNAELLCLYLLPRWNIVARCRHWDQLAGEITDARIRLFYDHPKAWFHLLVRVSELSIFAREPAARDLYRRTQKELTDLSHQQGRHADDLEFLDMLSAVPVHSAAYAKGFSGSRKLDTLIAESQIVRLETFRLRLMEVVQDWIKSPGQGLEILTGLSTNCPEALWLLLRCAGELGFFRDTSASDDRVTAEVISTFAKVCAQLDYHTMRGMVVVFCRDECLSGTAFLEELRLHAAQSPAVRMLLETMPRDMSLMLTCHLIYQFLAVGEIQK